VTYQEIPELTKAYAVSATALFNIYEQMFKWMKMEYIESSGNPATVSAKMGVKSQL
jgi:hypothetical protein